MNAFFGDDDDIAAEAAQARKRARMMLESGDDALRANRDH